MSLLPGIRILSQQLESRSISSQELVGQALKRASDVDAEGVFTEVDQTILNDAEAIDIARSDGKNVSPLAGIPLTLKDLFNVKGQVTYAGSKVLRGIVKPATADAKVVAPLRDAGMLFVGRANMSEFAFSGMGKNPHYDPLYSVWDRETKRLPGGSSSGSAVSVALGIVAGTLGSDTAGSCRIPAAFNGIVGVKPSFGRLSLQGIYPLSPTSDAPGPLAVDVDSCYLIDHVMSGKFNGKLPELKPKQAGELTLLIPEGAVMQGLDLEVAESFAQTVEKLSSAGIKIVRKPLAVIDGAVDMFLKRPVAVYEAYQHHQPMLQSRGELFDPYVRARISAGSQTSALEYQQRIDEKTILTRCFNDAFEEANIDGVIFPTTPNVPPPFPTTDDVAALGAINMRCLRNTAPINNVDGCSISMPCHKAGDAPVGLMLNRPHGDDQVLYEIAATLEAVIKG